MTYSPEIALRESLRNNTPASSEARSYMLNKIKTESDLQSSKDAAVFASNLKYGGLANRQKSLDDEATNKDTLMQALMDEVANRKKQRNILSDLLANTQGQLQGMDNMGQMASGGGANLPSSAGYGNPPPAQQSMTGMGTPMSISPNVLKYVVPGQPNPNNTDPAQARLQAIADELWPGGKSPVAFVPTAGQPSMAMDSNKNQLLYNPQWVGQQTDPNLLKFGVAHELGHYIHQDSSPKRGYSGDPKSYERDATNEGLALWVGAGGRPEDYLALVSNQIGGDKSHNTGAQDANYMKQLMDKGIYKSYRY